MEVKGIGTRLSNFEDQIKGQLLSCGKILCTNGNEWQYYDIEKYIEQYFEYDIEQIWAKDDYDNVKCICDNIELTEMKLAIKKASYAHTKNDEYKKVYRDEIQELEQEIEDNRKKLQNSLLNIQWLQNVMETPIIDKKIFENDNISVIDYMKLKSELYSTIAEWGK